MKQLKKKTGREEKKTWKLSSSLSLFKWNEPIKINETKFTYDNGRIHEWLLAGFVVGGDGGKYDACWRQSWRGE